MNLTKQKASVITHRWVNLSLTLWSLIIIHANRDIDYECLNNFFDVLDWRLIGQITIEEFSILYEEWLNLNSAAQESVHLKSKSNLTKLSLFYMKNFLFSRKYDEADLDLLVGLILHQENKWILDTPLSYHYNRLSRNDAGLESNQFHPAHQSLSLCTMEWINSSEELFFSLDNPGYGHLKYDELSYLSMVLLLGLQNFNSEEDVVTDLSVDSLMIMTVQLLRDFGGNALLRSTDFLDNSYETSISHRNHMVTLLMFKSYLMRQGVDTNELQQLSSHIHLTLHRLVELIQNKVGSLTGDDYDSSHALLSILASCKIPGNGQNGLPRLWQQAVINSTGHDPASNAKTHLNRNTGSSVNNDSMQSLLQFLFCVAELFLSAQLLVSDYFYDHESHARLPSAHLKNIKKGHPSALGYDEPKAEVIELHMNAFILFHLYFIWKSQSHIEEMAVHEQRLRALFSTQHGTVLMLMIVFDFNSSLNLRICLNAF
jgi:hypothetical protein